MSRVGDQLVLSLDDVRVKRAVVPWDGQSPRVLTAAYQKYKLKPQGGGHEVDIRQVEMFAKFGRVPIQTERAPEIYSGAPSLRRLPWEGTGHG